MQLAGQYLFNYVKQVVNLIIVRKQTKKLQEMAFTKVNSVPNQTLHFQLRGVQRRKVRVIALGALRE